MRLVATTLFGLERLAGEDIDAIEGCKRLYTGDGRVVFDAEPSAVPYCLINFRYAERVLLEVARFRAETFDQLFEGTKSAPWADYIGTDDQFPVKGHSIRSKLFSLPDCQRIIKKATVESLRTAHGVTDLPETGIKYQIVFFILDDEASIMIDLCGEPLHKRGYRKLHNLAPMRETLAAAMVNISRPHKDVCIVDPMCGSGTIPIEAALMVRNIAPGLYREFTAEQYPFIPHEAWQKARDDAKSAIRPAEMRIYGYDNDPECIKMAKANARAAGVLDDIVFERRDAAQFALPYEGARGTIVVDPPYGNRMGDIESSRTLVAAFGRAVQKVAPRWQVYAMSTDQSFDKYFGRRADKARVMHNGTERCRLFQFYKNIK